MEYIIDKTHDKCINIKSINQLMYLRNEELLYIGGKYNKFRTKLWILKQQYPIIKRWLSRNVIHTVKKI